MPAIIVGALFMAGNAFVAAMDGVVVRLIAGEIHPLGIVFFRNLFSLRSMQSSRETSCTAMRICGVM